MPGRRTRTKRARAWVWMYQQVFEVEEVGDEQTKDTDNGDLSCDSADDSDSTGR
jgi:hypothetical protein